jgi:coproporphyrinogen dehydrogenase HemZ
MIEICLSDKTYEIDFYQIVAAFYPGRAIKVYREDELSSSLQKLLREDNQSNGEQGEIAPTRDLMEGREVILYAAFYQERIILQMLLRNGQIWRETLDLNITKETKLHYKNGMKRLLYGMLSKATGSELPWGILTGIRPTKLVYQMLEKGKKEQEIKSYMRKEYLCSEQKITTSLQIADREIQLLRDIDYKNGYSLYIGIPFCPSTCLYCSFTSYSIQKFSDYVERYLQALEKEILYGSTCFPDKKLTCVYFGGGTPTTLSASQLDRLLGLVRKHFDFTHVKEFCVEAGRPDSINKDKLLVLKKWGVNRISINPQSMQQKTLDLIGRRHSVEQIKEAFHLARETGHENINMDIIIGLPGENTQDVKDTLEQIKELNPESLTVHTLAIKRAARLNIERENYSNLQPRDVSSMLQTTIQFAKDNDYLPYYLYRQKNMADNLENIGYAKYGKEGLYNILIMEEQQTILALGAGAMTKFVSHSPYFIDREDNVKSVLDYISRIDEMIERKRKFFEEHAGM